MENSFSLDLNLSLTNSTVLEVISTISNNPDKNKKDREQLLELFKNEMYKRYPENMRNNSILNQCINNLFMQIMDNNSFELNPNESSIFNSTQRSFFCEDLLPRVEKDLYFSYNEVNGSSDKRIINLIFDNYGKRINLPFSAETTVKEALQKFASKFALGGDYVDSFDFTIAANRLDINSEEKIGDKFKNNSLITVTQVKGLIAA